VHNRFTKFGKFLGCGLLTRWIVSGLFNYQNKMLEQEILGIKFRNPVGLSAGFDYEADLTQILPSVGFGHHTIGSVTRGPYEGNKAPRLGRLIKSRSLLVNKGLKSTGVENVIDSLHDMPFKIPIGVSVAKTNCEKTADEKKGVKDYVDSFKLWKKSDLGDYYELNISCPNAFGGEPFTTPVKLKKLLTEIDKLKLKKPMFLKMPLDVSLKETDALCKVALKHNVQGLIFANLTKDRSNSYLDPDELKEAGKGSFSGVPVREKGNKLIAFVYKKYGKKFVIIGCGGIFSAEDAYEKIKLGSSLVQMITGMIYNGPGVIGDINYGLVQLLKRDGYKNISEAIGKAHK